MRVRARGRGMGGSPPGRLLATTTTTSGDGRSLLDPDAAAFSADVRACMRACVRPEVREASRTKRAHSMVWGFAMRI
jgi:hypothetical protein